MTEFTGKFDVVSINIGNGWSPSANVFIAPVTGIYYFSFSFGIAPRKMVAGYINYGSTACESEVFDSELTNLDLASRGCLLEVTAGMSVAANTSQVGDSSYNETSFKGFFYSPILGNSAAWSVHNTGVVKSYVQVEFPVVFVNIGITWSPSANSVTISTAGTYYVEMVGQTSASGTIDMQLVRNKIAVIARLANTLKSNNVTRSRSVLIYLNAGDKLTVQCSNCLMSGDNKSGISFQGILLLAS